MRRRVLILFLSAILALAPAAMAGGWEEIARQPAQLEHIDSEDVDIACRDGFIYISTNHAVSIKIFTILGQTVAQSNLAAGTHRFKLPARGIYILKVGSATRRITV